ncbi:hypothetical protein C0J50_19226 [Silurus asotus]|uniref:Uncharacterized protein n=1 Tax=Silurus asotus TaxID=30991 RepID=A0AAD5ARY2_SILAS|nr:hypothetical protein C0J50_19226 [Silurus asotus]
MDDTLLYLQYTCHSLAVGRKCCQSESTMGVRCSRSPYCLLVQCLIIAILSLMCQWGSYLSTPIFSPPTPCIINSSIGIMLEEKVNVGSDSDVSESEDEESEMPQLKKRCHSSSASTEELSFGDKLVKEKELPSMSATTTTTNDVDAMASKIDVLLASIKRCSQHLYNDTDGNKGRARIRHKIRKEKGILTSVVKKYNLMVSNTETLCM